MARFPILLVLLLGLGGASLPAAQERSAKATSAASLKADREQVVGGLRQLGFSVGEVQPAGKGLWKAEILGFDPARAAGKFRGVVKGPATRFGNDGRSRQGDAARGSGAIRPGGTRSSADATGGNTGGIEGATPGRGAGGGSRSSGTGESGGATATGAGKDPGPQPSGGGGRSIQVSLGTDGVLSVSAASLRAIGLSASPGRVQGAKVEIR